MENNYILEAENVAYDYVTPAETVHALKDVTCRLGDYRRFSLFIAFRDW